LLLGQRSNGSEKKDQRFLLRHTRIRHRFQSAKKPGWGDLTIAVGVTPIIPEALAKEVAQGLLFEMAFAGARQR
jgi:hypothetical protein